MPWRGNIPGGNEQCLQHKTEVVEQRLWISAGSVTKNAIEESTLEQQNILHFQLNFISP